MTLGQNILQQLPATVGKQHERLTATAGLRTLRCEIDQCDLLAVTIFELVLETSELENVDIAKLQAASQALCDRVTYLLEPISPIESDTDGCVVQMRSSPPQQHENSLCYYEILLQRSGSVALRRYQKQPGSIRTRVAATFTHEVLGRLSDDFERTAQMMLED